MHGLPALHIENTDIRILAASGRLFLCYGIGMDSKVVENFILQLTVWREARGADLTAMAAVASTIKNRAKDSRGRWPKTVQGVCLQPKQFSCFNPDDPNVTKYPFPGNADWEAWERCGQAVKMTDDGWDAAEGANHYHTIPPDKPKPVWARPTAVVKQVGTFTFYKL